MSDLTETFASDRKQSVSDKLGVGSPARTLALRHEFSIYREEGGDMQWREWLESRGYGADETGNAYLKGDQ